jgi:diacylglycerol O-acyltransferase / wax synthase
MLVDRLSPLDEAFLRIETQSAHMHVGWTLLADGEPPAIEDLRAHVGVRLELLPRFRCRAITSVMHDPMWVEHDEFDLSYHVTRMSLPKPGTEPQLRAVAGALLSEPLDRRRPLWRLHLVDGLRDGGFAIIGRAHHALVDGVSAVEVAQLLLDVDPQRRETRPVLWEPAPTPPLSSRALATISDRTRLARKAGALALRTIANPSAVGEGAAALRRLGSALAPITAAAPRTALNRGIGPRRSVAFAELSLPAAKAVARRRGATVGDVVLATASLALGRALRRAGEQHPWLRTMVPVNTRPKDAGSELGNRISFVFVELPVGERRPRAALDEVARQMGEHKRSGKAGALDGVLRMARFAPLPVRDLIAWLATRPQTFNTVVSNIPGPRQPLYVLGRTLRAAYPAVPLARGHGLSVGILSYRDVLHVGVYADPSVVPDVDEVARDFDRSFDALRFAVAPHAPEPPESPESPEPEPVGPKPSVLAGQRADVLS